MTYKTRKHIWPVALMSLAVFGVLAAIVTLSVVQTQVAQAHPCDTGTIQERAQCDTDHENDGHDSTDPNHEHDANQPPVATGSLDDLSLRISMTHGPVDVTGEFEDPDGDDLTYSAMSDNPNVADAVVPNGMLTVTAGSIRGTARITVTADDDNGGTASLSFDVKVAEAYTLTADPARDADMPATFLVEDLGPYDAQFNLAVAGSEDDVTVTVTASVPAPATGGITITDSDGLIGAGFNQDNDLEGSLTVKATDEGSRAFEIEGMCETPGAMATIVVEDKDLDEVAKGYILCEEPPEPEAGPDRTDVSDAFTVVSYGDWEYEDVTDGFILDVSNGNMHRVNAHHSETGLLSRDEPVVHAEYTLGVSDKEMLGDLDNGMPRRAKDDPDNLLTRQEKNAYVEVGQRTVEVLVGQPNVQLTVTSMESGPAYIRFLDSNMQPFGTDVDEEPMWRGADVVGLDSQGRLELNTTNKLSKALALAYDQYTIVTPGVVPGQRADNSYLVGAAGPDGTDYNQGAFRFINPCPSVGHHFYVEVYESEGKYLETTEKIVCVPSPKPGPTGLEFTIDSQEPGEGLLRFEPALNAVSHTALLIDASNRTIVTTVEDAGSLVTFDNLNNGWTYHIVVVAEGAASHYTADGVKDFQVRWLGEADVPLSGERAPDPTRMHPLCQTGQANVMALLADCDEDPVNAAPTTVMAMVDDSDTGAASVTITWTDGANADRHVVFLFDSNLELTPDRIAGDQTDGTTTFNNIPPGMYIAVVVAVEDGPTGNAMNVEYGIASVTVN